VRAVGCPVAGQRERDLRQAGFDLLRAGEQRAHAGGAGLHHRLAADAAQPRHAGHPGQAVERMLLRHAEAEHAVVDGLLRDGALLQLLARDFGGELERIQIGVRALPAREGRAPVAAVGNFSLVRHYGDDSTLVAIG
jgi:hypothetical protein